MIDVHPTSHFTTDMLEGVLPRTLVHGPGTTCTSICAETSNGASIYHSQMHNARQEQAVAKPAHS